METHQLVPLTPSSMASEWYNEEDAEYAKPSGKPFKPETGPAEFDVETTELGQSSNGCRHALADVHGLALRLLALCTRWPPAARAGCAAAPHCTRARRSRALSASAL